MDNPPFQPITPVIKPVTQEVSGEVLPTSPVTPVTPVNPVVETNQVPSSTPPISNTVTTPPQPKKGIPPIIFVLLGVIVLGVILFMVIKGLAGGVAKKEAATITYWGLWEDDSIISPLIAEYEVANPGVKITYVRQSQQDYRERLTNAIAKGTAPDIFRFHNSWVPMFRSQLDYLPSTVMSAGEFAQTYYPVITSDLSSGTGIVGIPLGYDALTLYINEDIFAKAGKTPPTTWIELRQLAKELTVKDDQGTITQAGVALGRTENVDHWQEILALMMLQNGANLNQPTGKLAEDALNFFSVFSTQDGVWDATLPSSTEAFAAGKLAMYFAPSWRAFEIKQQNKDLKFRTVPLPQLPKENANEPGVSYASYWVEGVWTRSKNKSAAWNFLKFLSSKESLEKLYQNASRVRLFGEAYPRIDMASLLTTDPVLGTIVAEAPNAQSWYLYARTWDGPTGINSLTNKYFEDAVNSVNQGNDAAKALQTVSSGVTQVLTQYGLLAK